MVAPAITELGYELVRVAVLGRERPTVQIMADRADGTLIGVADCEIISRAVSAVLDVEDPIPGAWELEVSSAGIDRPLTREKDWNRFAGHQAKAELNIPIDGRKRFAGVALGAENGQARMRLDDGSEVSLPLTEMRRARLVLTDALIEASARMMKAAHRPGEEVGEGLPEFEIEAEASPDQRPARTPKPKRKTH
jgi:ribosome maturation factor RimP